MRSNTSSLRRKNLIIENFDFTELNVRVLALGQGSPKIAFLNGLHGLERTGAYLMAQLLPKIKIVKGTVSLIPFANPTAALKNTRLTPEDNQDLNRLFPGDAQGSLSFRLAAKLFDYLKYFDLTVDIHTFPKMQMPVVGVYLANTPAEKKEKLLKLIGTLKPDYLWKLDTETDEKNKAGSLIQALQDEGKLAFSLEVPDIEIISPEQEERVLRGLQKLVTAFVHGKVARNNRKVPIITRVPALSPAAGFFLPAVSVHQKVERGERLGEIISVDKLKPTPVTAPIGGPVVFILQKTFVLPGERAALIGKAVGE